MEDLSRIRNIGVAAHIDAGKTTTTERLLFFSGTIHKAGDVDDGTTITDFDVEEQQRGITIYSAAVTFHWRDCRVNLIDTPGHVDFTAEVERSLRVLDGAVVVFDAKEGVEAQSETVWRQADKYKVPRLCFINKMDKVGADFDHALRSICTRLAANPVPIHLPIGQEGTFRGFVDLLAMAAVTFTGSGEETKREVGELPDGLREEAQRRRHLLEEAAAELDDELMHHYLEHGSLSSEQIKLGLRKGTIALRCQPVLCGSALRYMGVQDVLDAVCDFLPSPLDIPPITGHDPRKPERTVLVKCDPKAHMAGLVFKVVADTHGDLFFVRVYSGVLRAGSRVLNVGRDRKENVPRLFRIFAKRREQLSEAVCGDIVAVIGLKDTLTGDTLCDPRGAVLLERIEFPETVISMSIEPKSSADRDKLLDCLQMLARSDPTFMFRADEETGQTIVSGMGELHLEVICHRLERDMNVPVRVGKPRVAYRETISHAGQAEGKLIRQAGGRSQYAVVTVRVEPFEPAPGQEHFQFANLVPEDKLRRNFALAAEQGARAAAMSGPLGSYPLINVRVELIDAEESAEDSSEVAFESAAAMAVTRAVEQAGPVLLEPIMRAEVVTPEEYFGAINGDLMSRRAVIRSTSMRGNNHVIDCEVPLSTMFGYSTQLRSLSQGRASYAMEPCRYEPMPDALAQKVLGAF
ncbi:MAG: elongation factor G [Phycisphaerae bacterium]|jgi:elongation factor G